MEFVYEFDVVTYRNGCEWAPAVKIDSRRDVDETNVGSEGGNGLCMS